jgi:hypothetical protein
MLEAGAIQARGGTLPGPACWTRAFAVKRPPCMYTVSVYKNWLISVPYTR